MSVFHVPIACSVFLYKQHLDNRLSTVLHNSINKYYLVIKNKFKKKVLKKYFFNTQKLINKNC